MKRRKLSRRDILQGLGRAGARHRVRLPRPRPGAASRSRSRRSWSKRRRRKARWSCTRRWICRSAKSSARPSRRSIPASTVQIERSGSERLFQRIDQEFASNIRAADVVNSSDASHFIVWKRNGWLVPFVPEDVARHFHARAIATPTACSRPRASALSSIAYNTNLVKAEDAPKSFADLLDPKWAGKMVKGHPGLQRHHHDRDLPDGARTRLGVLSRSCRSSA